MSVIIKLLEAWLRKVWGVEVNDEVNVNIALKAVQTTWVFSIAFLFAWSLYEIYKIFISHISVDLIPMILLGLQVPIFGLSHVILKNNSISKKILVSWIFGIVFLSAYILYNTIITPVPAIDIIAIPVILLSLKLVVFIFSRFILEKKIRKEINKERPSIWQARDIRGIILIIVLFLVLTNISLFFIMR